MKKLIIFLCNILFINLIIAQTFSSKEDREILLQYKSFGDSIIPIFRQQIIPFLNETERKIESEIEYKVVPTNPVQARAYIRDGKRYIEVYTGILYVIDWVATDMIIGSYVSKECAHQHLFYLFERINDNTSSVYKTGKAYKVYSPFEYAKIYKGSCINVSDDIFIRNTSIDKLRRSLIGGSVRWLLSHELGHHVYDHIKSIPVNNEENRRRETEADKFAFRMITTSDTHPFYSYPIFLITLGLGGVEEKWKDEPYPAGTTRFKIMLDSLIEMRNNDKEFKEYLSTNNLEDQYNKMINELKKMINNK